MENQKYDKEIDLSSLMYYLLRRWKIMLIIVLVFTIVSGGYKSVLILSPNTKTSLDDIVNDVIAGIKEQNALSGDALLYYNIVINQNKLASEIDSYEYLIEKDRNDLEVLRVQLAEFEQLQESVSSEDLSTFISAKNAAESAVVARENSIRDREKQMSDSQVALDREKGNAAILLNRISEEESSNNTKEIIKYILFGFVAGIFIFVFVYCMAYILSGKLRDTDVLRNAYGLAVLAVVPSKVRKGIDAQIEKLNGHASKTREQAYDTVYARLLNLVKGDKNRVLITGTISGEVIKMITYLNKKDSTIKYIFCPNPIENPDSILMFQNADIILLVECKNKSALKEIEQELEFIKDVNKLPLGVVVVN